MNKWQKEQLNKLMEQRPSFEQKLGITLEKEEWRVRVNGEWKPIASLRTELFHKHTCFHCTYEFERSGALVALIERELQMCESGVIYDWYEVVVVKGFDRGFKILEAYERRWRFAPGLFGRKWKTVGMRQSQSLIFKTDPVFRLDVALRYALRDEWPCDPVGEEVLLDELEEQALKFDTQLIMVKKNPSDLVSFF